MMKGLLWLLRREAVVQSEQYQGSCRGRSEGGAEGGLQLVPLNGQELPQARLLGLCICCTLLPSLGIPATLMSHYTYSLPDGLHKTMH